MRVGIDGRIAAYNNSGISRYFWGLLSGLAEAESELEYTVYLSGRRPTTREVGARFGVRYLNTPPHNIAESLLLPLEMKRGECSVYHAMDFYIPSRRRLPQVLSVYDLYFLHSPESLSRPSLRHYKKVIRYIREAEHVICSSESTRKDLLHFVEVDPSRVSVVYPGYTESDSAVEAADVLRRFGLSGPYLLFVGTIEPRKNLVRLFEAYAAAKKRSPSLPRLLLAGKSGYQAENILETIVSLGLTNSILALGELTDAEVSALYRGCEFVVYPSLYEGFGFPVLEGMAAGVPVLSANCSSIPEVAGDAALLVEPEDVGGLAAAIERLHEDGHLRAELIAKGLQRVKEFSWRKTADDVVSVYHKVAGQTGHC